MTYGFEMYSVILNKAREELDTVSQGGSGCWMLDTKLSLVIRYLSIVLRHLIINSYYTELRTSRPELLKFLLFLVITCIDRIEKMQYPRKK